MFANAQEFAPISPGPAFKMKCVLKERATMHQCVAGDVPNSILNAICRLQNNGGMIFRWQPLVCKHWSNVHVRQKHNCKMPLGMPLKSLLVGRSLKSLNGRWVLEGFAWLEWFRTWAFERGWSRCLNGKKLSEAYMCIPIYSVYATPAALRPRNVLAAENVVQRSSIGSQHCHPVVRQDRLEKEASQKETWSRFSVFQLACITPLRPSLS